MTDSRFYRVFVLPSAVFLSVIFGGSYGSGQEMVQFVTSAGPSGGYYSLLVVGLTWGLLLGTSFELARRFSTYEYSGFMQVLLKRGAVVYEIAILLAMLLVLAICASGAGSVITEHFGISVWIGSLGLLLLAALLNYFGRQVVERTMILSIVVLLSLLAMLCFTALATSNTDVLVTTQTTNPILSGGQYAIANGGFIPLLLYCGRGVRSGAESFTAGFIAAGVTIIPGILLHTSLLTNYPQVLQETLPTYAVINQLMSPTFLSIYVVVLFVMITQTAVGMLQGLVDRTDAFWLAKTGSPLTNLSHAALAAGMIGISMLLSTIGFVALIAQGYNILVLVFIVIFIVPLFTYGAYLLMRKPQ
ncbi:MAG: hypothetical protein P8P91_03365 [Pseudomonadales bacterium]|nr:hypothetical protein [Pseudomonadales bacterium]